MAHRQSQRSKRHGSPPGVPRPRAREQLEEGARAMREDADELGRPIARDGDWPPTLETLRTDGRPVGAPFDPEHTPPSALVDVPTTPAEEAPTLEGGPDSVTDVADVLGPDGTDA